LDKFFGACDPEERLWLEFFLMTGMREQEVMPAPWADINLNRAAVTVRYKADKLAQELKAQKAKSAACCQLLSWCVVWGIGFMVWLISHYEDHQHGNPHTRLASALSETVGFSSLTCFGVGYVWLIFKVTS
jgi:hypothetical protein